MYSEFEGQSLLDSYFIDRGDYISFLRREYSSVDFVSFEQKNIVNSSFIKTLREHDFLLEAKSSVSYTNNDGTIDTKRLLCFILSSAFNGSQNYFEILERIVKKFEISKKVYVNYSSDLTLGKFGYSDHDLYLILWCILLSEFLERNKFNYLSTALKISDLLISLGPDLNVSNGGIYLIVQLIKLETSIIMKLAQE